jgi:hypothetical protein
MIIQVKFIFRQVLAVLMSILFLYPLAAQTTGSSEPSYKLCMSTCIANSCSGPASVVEKNCARKCADQHAHLTRQVGS